MQGQGAAQVEGRKVGRYEDGQAVRVGQGKGVLPTDPPRVRSHAYDRGRSLPRQGEEDGEEEGAQTSTSRPQWVTPSGEQASQGTSGELTRPNEATLQPVTKCW